MNTAIRTVALVGLVALTVGCGKVEGVEVDAMPSPTDPDAAVDAPPPGTEVCTPATTGASAADEDMDGAVDEGCGWHLGTPHWLTPAVPSTVAPNGAAVSNNLEPNWISPDGLRLYVLQYDAIPGASRVLVLRRTGRDKPFAPTKNPPAGGDVLVGTDLANHWIAGITLSQDEKEAIFASRPAGGNPETNLFRMTRTSADGSFGTVEALAKLSTAKNEERPFLSADGKELFFASDRKIRRALRAAPADAFGDAEDITGLGLDKVNAPQLARDGKTLFFYGERPGPVFRIQRAERVSKGSLAFGSAVDVADLDITGAVDSAHPLLSESTQELFFSSYRAWGPNLSSLWRARICRTGACEPQRVECSGVRSPDGLHCYTRLPTAQNRADAEAACRTVGGHLASVHSPAEQTLVFTTGGSSNTWGGGYDDRNGVSECNTRSSVPFQCLWGWETGELWTYAPWGSVVGGLSEPEEGASGQDCLVLVPDYPGGGWADVGCETATPYRGVCESSLFPTW